MSISIKKLTLNTTVKRQAKKQAKAQKAYAKGLSKMDKDALIEECLKRVQEMIDYQLRP